MQRSNYSISKPSFPDYRLSLIAEDLLATLAARLAIGESNETLLACLTDTRRPNRLKYHTDFLDWIKSALPRKLPDLNRFDDLIDDLLRYSKIMADYLPACSAIDLARRELVILRDYIHHPPAKLTLREHCRRIDEMDTRQMSAYEAIHAWCVAHPLTGKDFLKGLAAVATKAIAPAKRRGKKSPVMDAQRKIFDDYLNAYPVTRSYSLIRRARDCWHLNETAWNKYAQTGEGYANHKSLAAAHRPLPSV